MREADVDHLGTDVPASGRGPLSREVGLEGVGRVDDDLGLK